MTWQIDTPLRVCGGYDEGEEARGIPADWEAWLVLRREGKRAKLLQYAERVWHISEGSEDARIEAAIQNTRAFFESLSVPTRLSAYNISADAIPALLAQLESHGMVKLGEHEDVTLDKCREVLEASI